MGWGFGSGCTWDVDNDSLGLELLRLIQNLWLSL